ncbi:MAG: PQQ-dependent sugar dehydrogenase [Rhizobiales bacterium]|nr:PQQ-dependent sugar dehydrogenase [Hyphomicrobiales bacterium]
MKSAIAGSVLALATVLSFGGAPQATAADGLKSYQSGTKEFWTHPPDDWFLGDETEAQKGLAPPSGPPTGMSDAEIAAALKKIKLPKGFKIEPYATGVLAARQMAWGDKGTLFVGSFGLGNVYAITDKDGKKEVKTILKGLKMPTGLAYLNGALYVVDINKIMRYDNPEANLDKMPEPKVVYDDMPSYAAHGWKYIAVDKDGWFYIPLGPPFNIGLPPTSVSQIRRVDPKTGNAELVALGVRNSVGGDVDPRSGKYWFTENARDWLGDNSPSDKLNMISRLGEHFGYPYCHQGDIPDPKFAMGHKCSEFTPPIVKLGDHVAPLGMKFYTGSMFPAEYKNNILIAEHGSWNRHQYQGARIVRVIVGPDGKNPKTEVFASGWIEGKQTYLGRPADVIQAKDGSILIADDWAGAIYRISYDKAEAKK